MGGGYADKGHDSNYDFRNLHDGDLRVGCVTHWLAADKLEPV